MNCASRILPYVRERAAAAALWTTRDGVVTFGEFGALAAAAQTHARSEGLVAGDAALVLATPGPRLFATVTGLVALGITVVFVEPWMPVREIDHVLGLVKPKMFVGSTLAQLWGARVRAVRQIPRWVNMRRIARGGARTYAYDDVDPALAAMITFTSGTTGTPKGIVRTHSYMWNTHEILTGMEGAASHDAPDLCVFPSMALLQLGTGRGAVLAPSEWSVKGLRALEAVPETLRPVTLTCGPAFLLALLRHTPRDAVVRSLRSVYVGGALTDRWIFDHSFARWPDARFTHVYGGTEVEPVAHSDARICVRKSAERNVFQTLHIGVPIPEIRSEQSPAGLWVSGPNVAPGYIGNDAETRATKRVDDAGVLWHCMGDRIEQDADGWWYAGRATQRRDDFMLEQRIYAFLESSKCFVHGNARGGMTLYGEGLGLRASEIMRAFPEIESVQELPIVRDRRHRARIDRARSLGRRAPHAA